MGRECRARGLQRAGWPHPNIRLSYFHPEDVASPRASGQGAGRKGWTPETCREDPDVGEVPM